jgi:hypothetical protein
MHTYLPTYKQVHIHSLTDGITETAFFLSGGWNAVIIQNLKINFLLRSQYFLAYITYMKNYKALVNYFYGEAFLMRMLARIAGHCYTNGTVTLIAADGMPIVVPTQ